MSYGIDYESLAQEYVQNNSRYYTPAQNRYSTAQNTTNDSIFNEPAVSEKGNTCTDGKDDGKIGFFSMVGNVLQGAGKAIVNGVKGMFCDSDGHFSLGNTLKTVAMGALCVAFPAVGLAMCGVGILSGGFKVVTGIANALGADTDAEAKDKWEQVGEGGLTLGLSIVGAKASYNAVQTSATAAAEGGQTAMQALKAKCAENGTKASLLDQARALGQDCWSSTKYNFTKFTNFVKTTYRNLRAKKYANDTWEAHNSLKYEHDAEGNLTEKSQPKQQEAIEKINAKRAKADQTYQDKGVDFHQMTEDAHSGIAADKNALKAAQLTVEKAAKQLADARQSGDPSAITAAQEALRGAKTARSQVIGQHTAFGRLTTSARTSISTALEGLKNMSLESLAEFGKTLFTNPKELAIYKALTSTNASYNQIVSQYGYKNVMGVIEVIAQQQALDNTI